MSTIGCSRSEDGDTPKDGAGPIEAMYLLNSDIVRAADRLKESTIQACMLEQGFQYQTRPLSAVAAAELAKTEHFDNELVLEGLYGLGDADQLLAPSTTIPDPNQARVDAMDETERTAYLHALTVDTSAGPSCTSAGEAAAAEAIVGPATIRLGVLYGDLMVRVRADSTVMDAQAAWQQCMHDAGFSYQSREDIIGGLKEDVGRISSLGVGERTDAAAAVQSRAADLAKVDVDCDEAAGLERVTREVQLTEERKLAETESALLADVDRERTQLLKDGDSDG